MSHDATVAVECALSLPENRDLSPVDRLVLTKLANYCGAKQHGKASYPAIETLARQTARTTRTVQRSLKKLEQRKLIIRDKTGGRGNAGLRYRFPEPVKGDTEPIKGDTHACHPLKPCEQKSDTVKGDISSHERVTKTALKGDIPDHASYEQEQRTKNERAQAALGLPAQRSKSERHAGVVTSIPDCFRDGWPFEYSFAYATDFVPELFSSPPDDEDLALYSTWTRDEFEVHVDVMKYHFVNGDFDEPATPYVPFFGPLGDAGNPANLVVKPQQQLLHHEERRHGTKAQPAQEVQSKTSRGRRPHAGKSPGLRDDSDVG